MAYIRGMTPEPPDETPLKTNGSYTLGPEDGFHEEGGFGRWIVPGAIALGVSALFGLLSALYIVTTVQDNVRNDALVAAHHNCSNLRSARLSGNAFRFGIREELAFIPDVIATSKNHKLDKQGAAFLAAEVKRLNTDLQIERKLGTPGLPTHISGFGDLFPLFADTKPLNCSTSALTHR